MKGRYIGIASIVGAGIIAGTIGINQIVRSNGPIMQLKQDEFTVEYGTSISTSIANYVDINASKAKLKGNPILDSKLKLDLDGSGKYPEVGTYQGTIDYANEDEPIQLTFTVKVEDTTKPEIKQYLDLESYVGMKLDYEEYFGVKDLSKVKVEYDDSDVNYDKEGHYELVVKATDEHGNSAKLNTEVTIKKPEINFKLSGNKLTLKLNQTTVMKPEVLGSEESLEYSIDDEEIASVNDNGKIIPKKKGKTNVRASIGGTEAMFVLQVI